MRSLLALLALLAVPAAAIVVGIDMGNEFMKVSLVKPGQSFQIVTNVASKRKTPVMIAYYQGERLFGSDAEALMARKPRQVFADVHRVLGRNLTHPIAVDYANHSYYVNDLEVNDRGGVDFVLPGDGSAAPEIYSAEEVVAQVLAHAKEFTETHAGSKVRDAVMTVPSYYTQNERTALLDAAELAGFNVLSLVDENTAAGIHYGIDRVTENGTHYMMLYNMGHESTQVTLFAYDSYTAPESKLSTKTKAVGQGRVIGKAWDTQLGGRWFDKALVEYCCDVFNRDKGSKLPADAKGDIRNVPSAMVKIRKNVAKAKEILSANEEYPVNFESLTVNEIDYKVTLSRKLLDEAAEKLGLWKRVTGVIEEVLAQSGLPLANVSVVEIVGGGVRMPRVQSLLKDYLASAAAAAPASSPDGAAAGTVAGGPSLGVHLNGDEAFALGAAFAAANRSAAFRVRKVGMLDGCPFPIGVRLGHLNPGAAASAASASSAAAEETADAATDAAAAGDAPAAATGKATKAWAKRSALFRSFNPYDSVKRITFNADRDLKATLFYENATAVGSGAAVLPAGTSRTIGVYNISGIEALLANETIVALTTSSNSSGMKVHISFELDHSGIARVVKAEATIDVEIMVPEPTPKPTVIVPSASPAAAADGDNATDSNATATDASASASPAAEADASASPSPAAEEDAAAASASPSAAAEPKMRAVKKTHKYPLAVTLDVEATAPQVAPLSAADKASALARLKKLKAADDEKRQLEGAKNALEAYIYAAREKREGATESGEYESITNEEQREAIGAALMDAEEWLYGDGANADLATYKAKLKEVKTTIEPAFFRLEEARERSDLIEKGRDAIAGAKSMVAGWAKSHPQIDANETMDAIDAVNTFESWFNRTLTEQEALAGHESPVLTRDTVAAKAKLMGDLLVRLSKKPKPTPTPTPKPSTTPKAGKAGKKGGKAAKESRDYEDEYDEYEAQFGGAEQDAEEAAPTVTPAPTAEAEAEGDAAEATPAPAAAEEDGKEEL